jgi:protein TonB
VASYGLEPGDSPGVQASRRGEWISCFEEAIMRWFMLPVSIGAHVIAALAMLIVPLAAEVEWPAPAPLHGVMLTAVAPVPPEVVALAAPRRAGAAPSVAPRELAAEREIPPVPGVGSAIEVPAGAAIDAALPSGLGTAIPIAPVTVPEPAPPVRQAPVRSGQGVREPRKLVDVRPVYPPIALSARIEGAVILEAVINERGEIERVKVLRSQPLLDGAAIDAVRQWRYTPTLLNGAPVAVLMTITINFTLQR